VSIQALSTVEVDASDGVKLAVHDFGGDGPPLVVSHATGFHAHCYVDMIGCLRGSYRVHGLDYRGHGGSSEPRSNLTDWSGFAADLLQVCRSVGAGEPVSVFGHSMGAAAALMVSDQEPGLISSAVLFEPITPPPAPGLDPESIPLVIGARRRRATFPDHQTAIENYGSKPPLSLMTPSTLQAYVEFGTRPHDDGVTLACRPGFEGDVFASAHGIDVWSHLPEISLRCLVLAGADVANQPSSFAGPVANRLPNATFRRLAHQTHFGPFSHPDEIADSTTEFLRSAT
jgi:pimeloyl-ACP methyl ester carboxylesterase